MNLETFRQNKAHCQRLAEFLNTETGRDLVACMRSSRKGMVYDKSISEQRACGRHDVFQELETIFFDGIQPADPVKTPMSQKGRPGATLKPHQSKLP